MFMMKMAAVQKAIEMERVFTFLLCVHEFGTWSSVRPMRVMLAHTSQSGAANSLYRANFCEPISVYPSTAPVAGP